MDAPKTSKFDTVEENDDYLEMGHGGPEKHSGGLVIAVVAVILAIGGTLWLLSGDEEPAPDLPPLKPLPTLGPQPGAAPASAAERGEQGRVIIAGLDQEEDAAAEAFAEGQRLQQEGKVEDAYLLYFFAAKRGHTEAALALGAQADPAHFDPVTSVLRQADPGQAYKWYRKAADNGSAEAERRLASLYEKVKNAAAAGDEKADRLLLQWR